MALKEERKIYVGIGLDLETGDLDCKNGAITQISAHAVRLDTLETMEKLTLYVYPYAKKELAKAKSKTLKTKYELDTESSELMTYDDRALTYSNVTMDMLYSQGIDIEDMVSKFIDFVSRHTLSKARDTKPILIGQNIIFDIGFLQQMFNYTGKTKELESLLAGIKDYYGNFQPAYIDTLLLGRLVFANDPSIPNFKLGTLCEKLGIELDDAHNADADVEATLGVAFVFANRVRNNNSNGDGGVMKPKEKTRDHFKI